MNKKILFIVSLFIFYQTNCFYYINNEEVTFKSILTGDTATSIHYNMLNNQDGNIGGDKRLVGIHNMTVEIPGYEVIHLVKNDVCLHPSLFTMWNIILPDNNMLVQRWACVKWLWPLSFGFKVENDSLTIFSSIWQYRLLSPFRAQKTIHLIKKSDFNLQQAVQDLMITVAVNGRICVASQRTVVQIYSTMSRHAISYTPFFWLL